MDWTPVLDFLLTLTPWMGYLFMALGALVTIGIMVDSMIDDEKDKGFMKKILAIPLLGDILKGLKRFSPFNTKE